ncbi:hypothetical protein [Treponema sp.]|uniref:hypothetical protein n=1 Tax=Treponema sp. TaxID=166 RepID=UPI00388E4C18
MSKLMRPEYRRMYEVMRLRLGKNLSKCVFIILIFNLLQSFLFGLTLSPIVVSFKTEVNPVNFVFSALSTSFVFFFSFQFLYGIISYFTKLMLARRDVMGVFTSGLNDRTKRAHFVSMIFSLIMVVSALLAAAFVVLNKERILAVGMEFVESDTEEALTLINSASIFLVFCAIFFICGILLSVPFLFSWNILIDDKKISAVGALLKSFSLMVRNYFHYIGFVIYACFKNVMFVLIFFGINLNLSGKDSVAANLCAMLLGFLAFIQQYTIIAKVYTSIPIYYYSLLSVNGMISSEKNENESSSE